MPMLRALLLLAVACAALPARAGSVQNGGELPAYEAADASAALITETNLLASDAFWPYQVALVQPFAVKGAARTLEAGLVGVLIRVQPGGVARIDFGRDGLHELPVAATDLVERANRVRSGELSKLAPNFALAIGPRLGDASAPSMAMFGFAAAAQQRGFVSVFVDPTGPELAELAKALAPLAARPGVLTVVFPQGEHPDEVTHAALRAAGWRVPFVLDHLAESYSRTLLGDGVRAPALALQSADGRLLYESPWRPGAAADLTAALDAAFPDAAP